MLRPVCSNKQYVHFVFMLFLLFSVYMEIICLNSIKKLIFLMVKYYVYFAVRTEFLSTFVILLCSDRP
jgi:hypothetical protein